MLHTICISSCHNLMQVTTPIFWHASHIFLQTWKHRALIVPQWLAFVSLTLCPWLWRNVARMCGNQCHQKLDRITNMTILQFTPWTMPVMILYESENIKYVIYAMIYWFYSCLLLSTWWWYLMAFSKALHHTWR